MIEVTAIVTKSGIRIEIEFDTEQDGQDNIQKITVNDARQLRDELTELLEKMC